ncbi:MAG: glycosyltransferase family 39 protein [Acidobacteriaceae bacterium]|nr:glycosyltransferase family 39 protein [Acidobacteriaceae bacterium]MBV9502247.1 glycosyltransferase family 39 protein [Acidobacteriaceae bacterium]
MQSEYESLNPSIPARQHAPLKPGAFEWIALCATLWTLCAFLQWRGHAFAVEFGSHPDESAHYVTGLMIRDYLASGHYTSPEAYAEHYYVHYPKVALGMWPPFFPLVEATWMLIFSPAKASVLLLMALITAITAACVYRVLRKKKFDWPLAFAGAALYVLLPAVQTSTSAVMADGLVTLLDLCAMMCLMRYVERERTQDAVLFGLCVALSMLTKANGVALLLLPVFTILLTRRFRLLRARALYYSAAIAIIGGAPWQVVSYRLIARSGGVHVASLIGSVRVWLGNLQVLGTALGWGLAPFCVLGILIFLIRFWRPHTDVIFASAFSLLLSVWLYHSLIGSSAPRYMLAALPPALVFSVAGFVWAVRWISVPAVPWGVRGVALGALAGGLFVTRTWRVPYKPYQGFDQPARFLLAKPEFAHADFLVISNANGEGAFVSEVAMHDRRPDHFVLRSTKVMSSSTWYGTIYQSRYKTAEEIRAFLDLAPIKAILLDTRPAAVEQDKPTFELQRHVAEVLDSDPHWKLRERFPNLASVKPWIDLYSRVGPEPPGQVSLDLRYTLGKQLVHSNCKQAQCDGKE